MIKNLKFTVNYCLMNSSLNTNELLILEPDTKHVTGDVLFFHGHQIGMRIGAWETPKYLVPLLLRGYRIIVPSILGYGKTTGDSDYCGPNTLKRVASTVTDFINSPVHVVGASRGGTLAILFAEHFPELTRSCTAIAGTYDLESLTKQTLDEKMKQNIINETGGTLDSYKMRDPKTSWKKIVAPIHIIHGSKDEQIPVEQAKNFVVFLQTNGLNPKLSILESASHKLFSEQTFNEIIIPFLEKT